MNRIANNSKNEIKKRFLLRKRSISSIALTLIILLCNTTTLSAFIGSKLDYNKILRRTHHLNVIISIHDGRKINTPSFMVNDDVDSLSGTTNKDSLSLSSSRSPAFVSTLSSSDPTVKSMRLMDAAAEMTRASTGGSLLGVKSLGIDYGTVRTGVAVTVGYNPKPLTILATSNETTCHDIVSLVQQEQATRIVLGLPLHKNGTVAEQTIITMGFARNLTAHVYATLGPNFPVYLWDERYTSKEAVARMTANNEKDDRYIDADAACIILEHYYSDGGMGSKVVDLPQHEKETLEQRWNEQKRKMDQQRELYDQERETSLNAKKKAIEKAKMMERKIAEKYGTPSNNKKKKKKKKKNNTSGATSGGKKWITF